MQPHGSKWPQSAGAYSQLFSMKPTRSIAATHGWDASLSQVSPKHFVTGTQFILLGEERQIIKNLVPDQRSNQNRSIRSRMTILPPFKCTKRY